MICPICNNQNITTIYNNFQGYIEGTFFSIYDCQNCHTQFISSDNIDKNLYKTIYSNQNTPGYDRYFSYAKTIKSHNNPIKFLSDEESTYFPIYQSIKDYSVKLNILEVGCGYGYLTYALNCMGHITTGIDISDVAIQFAKSNFGDFYHLASLNNFFTKDKFDIIVATELIEHLPDQNEFIKLCDQYLNEKGRIIITTPNRDYSPKNACWQTDLPPIHTVWLSKKSFIFLSNQNNFDYNFIDFSNYCNKKENILLKYLSSRRVIFPYPVLKKDGNVFEGRIVVTDFIIKKYIKKLLMTSPIRYISCFFAKLFRLEFYTLAIILKRKSEYE